MDLGNQLRELLTQQISVVVVRVFETFPNLNLPIGTALLITKNKCFGHITKCKLQDRIFEYGQVVLKDRVSHTTTWKVDDKNVKIFWEVFAKPDTIVIVGAGHIAMPLCKISKTVGYRVVVLDDREDYANTQRFPQADQILVGSFVTNLGSIDIDKQTYIVLVTRGHTYDKDCLQIVINKSPAYIGMIGSLRRLAGVFRLMEEQGYSKESLAKIHAPIGLPIGGDSPEVIALSIVTEIASVHHRGPEWSLKLKEEFKILRKSRIKNWCKDKL